MFKKDVEACAKKIGARVLVDIEDPISSVYAAFYVS